MIIEANNAKATGIPIIHRLEQSDMLEEKQAQFSVVQTMANSAWQKWKLGPVMNTSSSHKLNREEIESWLNKMDKVLDSHFVYQGDGPSEIIPGFLWLGDYQDAQNKKLLQNYGITWILNCAGGDINIGYPRDFRVHKFKARDRANYNLVEQHMDESVEFINKCKNNRGKILVHCVAGMNRSATITVGYLLNHFQDMDLLQAIKYTVKKRSWILTNAGFRRQLIQYAAERNQLKDERPSNSKL